MKFIAKKRFSSIRFGNVQVGDIVPVDGSIAKQMVDAGMVELSKESAIELRQKELEERKKAAQQKAKK